MSGTKMPAGVGVVGLGYVGLPLAVAFGRKFPTVGYDLSRRIGRAEIPQAKYRLPCSRKPSC